MTRYTGRLTERGEQEVFAAWADNVAPRLWGNFDKAWCHPANEGERTARYGASLKRAGMKRGVPDILVFVAVGKYHGLAIELKTAKGRLTPEQQGWLDRLNNNGWLARVCYSGRDAIDLATDYMEGRV